MLFRSRWEVEVHQREVSGLVAALHGKALLRVRKGLEAGLEVGGREPDQEEPVSGRQGSLTVETSSGVPLRIILPSFIITSLSAIAASSIKCVMRMTVIPSSLSCLAILRTSSLPLGSSIAVGSSRIMHSGFIAKTPAIAILCF